MTISSTTNRVSYEGNGVTTAFSFPYYFLADGDLAVYQEGTLKTITTHYTVTGAGDLAGGNVTFLTAPASGDEVVILRDPAITQTVDLVENDPLPVETAVERPLDKLTMIAQRLADLVTRSFRLADSDVSGASTLIPTPEADKVLAWDSAGENLINVAIQDFVTVAGTSNFVAETYSGTGAQTVFTLPATAGNVVNVAVYIDGVRQVPTTDYTVSGTTLTFTTAPASGTDNILTIQAEILPVGTIASENASYDPGGGGAITNVRDALRAIRQSIVVAASDETTALTTGTSKIKFRMPYAFTLTAVRASLSTAQTSGSIFTVDINESGSTILSTKLTIDNGEKTSTTAATPAVVSDAALADDAEISIDIDQIGDGTAKGLKVTLIGKQA